MFSTLPMFTQEAPQIWSVCKRAHTHMIDYSSKPQPYVEGMEYLNKIDVTVYRNVISPCI